MQSAIHFISPIWRTGRVAFQSAISSFILILALGGMASAGITLREPEDSARVTQANVTVTTSGSLFTAEGQEKSQKHAIEATATFRFHERRLPSGGRDAAALRSIREFETAHLKTVISDRETEQNLPNSNRQIVATGADAGVWVYSPTGLLSRESMDLLELPGEPLALQAMLPTEAVEIGGKWTPAPWSIQMLATVEAVQKSEMSCKLVSVKGNFATIHLSGSVLGQRYGANTDVKISGDMTFDVKTQLIASAKLTYQIKANIGTVNPGIDATVNTVVARKIITDPGTLTDAVVDGIPVSPPRSVEMLTFDAAPWKVQLLHDRQWHLFQSDFEGNDQVVIFRLVENGSLISQCNVGQIPTAPAGQHASLDQFEGDIQKSLGNRFKALRPREKVPADNGQTIYRVVAEGQTTLAGEKGAVEIPMQWNYYLLAAPNGRQLSFVFAIEPQLVEQLKDRDLEIVRSVRFLK